MGMTNAERQAKWREKLKAQAAAGQKFEDAMRARMLELIAEWNADLNDKESLFGQRVADNILGMTNDDLSEWFERRVLNFYRDTWREVSKQLQAEQRKATKAAEAAPRKAERDKARKAGKKDVSNNAPLITGLAE